MKILRNFLYFVVGVLLSAVFTLAFAETIPATSVPAGTTVPVAYWHIGSQFKTSSPEATCALMQQTLYPSGSLCSPTYFNECRYKMNAADSCRSESSQRVCPAGTSSGANFTCVTTEVTYTCPTTGGWTLQGTQCTRPDCVSPNVRNATTGACESPCAAKANQSEFSWVTYFNGSPPASSACSGGCAVYQTLNAADPAKPENLGIYYFTATTKTVQMKTQWTGESCTVGGSTPAASDPNPPTAQPPEPPKKPVCAASEGVLTSSKGTVACVPSGTPSAEAPKVSVKKTTDTFSDGSQKITTDTTTQVPSTGVTDHNISVQITPNSSGTPGAAGTPGTSGSSSATSTDTTGDGQGDKDGECDPKKDFCGGPNTGGLYEGKGKTVQSVVTAFKDGVTSSGIGAAATGFFNVSVPGGACPNWVVDVAFLNTSLNLSQYFCTSTAISMMNLVGGVLLFVAGFVGFRWAIL